MPITRLELAGDLINEIKYLLWIFREVGSRENIMDIKFERSTKDLIKAFIGVPDN